MIASLVAVPTVSSARPELDRPNGPAIDLLATWLTDLGFRIDMVDVPRASDAHASKRNLVATLGDGPDGLAFSGHMDTVPYDVDRWTHDPFVLREADGRLYGLGVADMKAFFAIVVEAVRALDGAKLAKPIVVVATADEESTMAGARTLVARGIPRARHAVIGEPTGLRPARAHKGVMMEQIVVRGRSGHSSDPSLGASAIEAMHRVIAALLAWRDELAEAHRDPSFSVPVPTLNLGSIRGGDAPNRIAAECELWIDIRPLPGMEAAALREELGRRVQGAVARTGCDARVHSGQRGVPPFSTSRDTEIVRAVEELTGHEARSVLFGTEAPYWTELGMDTVVIGPGDIEQAHQPDEFLALERIDPTIELLTRLMHRFVVAL